MRKIIIPIIVLIVAIILQYTVDDNKKTDTNKEVKLSSSKNNTSSIEDLSFYYPENKGQIVEHNYYSLSYNEEHEQANWVAYSLHKDQITRNENERPYFEIDNKVTTKAAHWRNYKQSGFDKGHLCPAGDRKFSTDAYNETFLTSNISPQKHQFNAGIWNNLEQKIRFWIVNEKELVIITGGILEDNLQKIGKDEVTVPKEFYKIVYNPRTNNSISFLIPQTAKKDDALYSFVTSIDAIEEKTNIDFFKNFPFDLENKIEAETSYKNWFK